MSSENQELRDAGLKVTHQRVKILQMLESSETKHVSAEDVYKMLLEANEDTGLATVYRVLTQFEAAGLVTRHHFEGGTSVFELSTEHHHDHIVCNKCGQVQEFYDEVIEEQQEKIARKYEFKITDTASIYTGFARPVIASRGLSRCHRVFFGLAFCLAFGLALRELGWFLRL